MAQQQMMKSQNGMMKGQSGMMECTDRASAQKALAARKKVTDKARRRQMIQCASKHMPNEAHRAMMEDRQAGLI